MSTLNQSSGTSRPVAVAASVASALCLFLSSFGLNVPAIRTTIAPTDLFAASLINHLSNFLSFSCPCASPSLIITFPYHPQSSGITSFVIGVAPVAIALRLSLSSLCLFHLASSTPWFRQFSSPHPPRSAATSLPVGLAAPVASAPRLSLSSFGQFVPGICSIMSSTDLLAASLNYLSDLLSSSCACASSSLILINHLAPLLLLLVLPQLRLRLVSPFHHLACFTWHPQLYGFASLLHHMSNSSASTSPSIAVAAPVAAAPRLSSSSLRSVLVIFVVISPLADLPVTGLIAPSPQHSML